MGEKGGVRKNAGRPKKLTSDKHRVMIWFDLVRQASEHLNESAGEMRTYIDRQINVIDQQFYNGDGSIKKNVFELLNPEDEVQIGGEAAWYYYAKGERLPHRDFAKNIDKYIVYRNCRPIEQEEEKRLLIKHPIRWVLARPGEMNLTPVWGWSPFRCSSWIERTEISLAAKVHAEFFERIPNSKIFDYLNESGLIAANDEPPVNSTFGLFKPNEEMEWEPHDFKWPPILLLPKILADCCAKHTDLPIPYIHEEPPKTDYTFQEVDYVFDKEKMLKEFAEWSMTAPARASGGDVWLDKISAYLDFYFGFGNHYLLKEAEIGSLMQDVIFFAEKSSPSFASRPRLKPEDDPFYVHMSDFDD